MKKTLSLLTALLAMGSLMAQTPEFVSTEPSNRNAVIEEYTGVQCTYCPDGHKRVNELIAQYPGRVVAINIHAGGYATMYQTEWGNALMQQTGIQGFPSGTVNRHVFSGNATILGREQFANRSAAIMAEASPVNVAAKATIDPWNRLMSIDVELYYTDDQKNLNSNMLNVVLLQDNVFGPQTGAQAYYPEMIENGKYRHNHMLRDMITGQWGEQITTIGKGTLVKKHYDYVIPSVIGDVPIDNYSDLRLAVFVAQGKQEIITGTTAEISPVPPAVFFYNYEVKHTDCELEYKPTVSLVNQFSTPITNITYTYNGTALELSDTVAANGKIDIVLPTSTLDTTVAKSEVQKCNLKLTGYTYIEEADRDTVVETLPLEATLINSEFIHAQGPLRLDLAYDHYASETSASLLTFDDCSSVWKSGSVNDRSSNTLMPARHYFYKLSPEKAGLYIFRVTDSYGDGMMIASASDPSGFTVTDKNGTKIITNDGDFTDKVVYYIYVDNDGDGEYAGIEETVNTVSVSLYPNPVHSQLHINASEPVQQLDIIDMNGRTAMTFGAGTHVINTESLQAGIYVVRVTTNSGISMQKFVKE